MSDTRLAKIKMWHAQTMRTHTSNIQFSHVLSFNARKSKYSTGTLLCLRLGLANSNVKPGNMAKVPFSRNAFHLHLYL